MGNAVYAACQWGMLVILAKLGSPEMVGQFTLGLAITSPVLMLTNLHLRVAQATDTKQHFLFSDYLGLRYISTGLALMIITAITLLANYRWETSLVVLAIGVAKAFESMSDVFYGLIQQHERMDRIAISMMIKGPLSLLLLSIGISVTGSVLAGAIGLAVAWAIVLIGYDIRSGQFVLNDVQPANTARRFAALRPAWRVKTLIQLVWLCLPLGLVMMLISLNTNVPRYFIEHYLGERELGIFAAISYLMVAGNLIVNALGESACPRLAKYYSMRDAVAFRTLLLKLVGVAALLGGSAILVAWVAGKEILTMLYRPEYAQQAELLVWLMVAAAIGYIASFLGYGITAAQYFRVQMPLFVGVTGTSALTCLWLLPRFGLKGAAIALIISALVQIVIMLGVTAHAFYTLTKPSPESA